MTLVSNDDINKAKRAILIDGGDGCHLNDLVNLIPTNKQLYIYLVSSDNCRTDIKIKNVQKANGSGLVVYGNKEQGNIFISMGWCYGPNGTSCVGDISSTNEHAENKKCPWISQKYSNAIVPKCQKSTPKNTRYVVNAMDHNF